MRYLLAVGLVVLSGCGGSDPPAPPPATPPPPVAPDPAEPEPGPGITPAVARPESEDELSLKLKAKALNLLAISSDNPRLTAEISTLRLPDASAWFHHTYKKTLADRLTINHESRLPHFERGVANAFRMMAARGITRARVYRLSSPDDPKADPLQRFALKAMVNKTDLYTVDFTREDGSDVKSMWNFAYVDGDFRLVGRLIHAAQE